MLFLHEILKYALGRKFHHFQRRGKCYKVGGANWDVICCDSYSGVQGQAPPPVTGMATKSEAEALTNLRFFVAVLKTDALAGKCIFWKILSVTLTFESIILYKRNQFVAWLHEVFV